MVNNIIFELFTSSIKLRILDQKALAIF